jgi:hypothetical protein
VVPGRGGLDDGADARVNPAEEIGRGRGQACLL